MPKKRAGRHEQRSGKLPKKFFNILNILGVASYASFGALLGVFISNEFLILIGTMMLAVLSIFIAYGCTCVLYMVHRDSGFSKKLGTMRLLALLSFTALLIIGLALILTNYSTVFGLLLILTGLFVRACRCEDTFSIGLLKISLGFLLSHYLPGPDWKFYGLIFLISVLTIVALGAVAKRVYKVPLFAGKD